MSDYIPLFYVDVITFSCSNLDVNLGYFVDNRDPGNKQIHVPLQGWFFLYINVYGAGAANVDLQTIMNHSRNIGQCIIVKRNHVLESINSLFYLWFNWLLGLP